MKGNPVTTALLGALMVVAILAAILVVNFNRSAGALRLARQKFVAFQNNRVLIPALTSRLNEYSKRDPAIDPLLKSFNLKIGVSNAPAATAPKPATR